MTDDWTLVLIQPMHVFKDLFPPPNNTREDVEPVEPADVALSNSFQTVRHCVC